MFKNLTTAYDGTNATIEILIMLAVAFILGLILAKTLYNNPAAETTVKQKKDKKSKSKNKEDNLKIVEGIGPKIEELLKKNGISNIEQLANSNAANLKAMLASAGDRYALHDPSTWCDQASLARDGKFKELEDYQNLIVSGVN